MRNCCRNEFECSYVPSFQTFPSKLNHFFKVIIIATPLIEICTCTHANQKLLNIFKARTRCSHSHIEVVVFEHWHLPVSAGAFNRTLPIKKSRMSERTPPFAESNYLLMSFRKDHQRDSVVGFSFKFNDISTYAIERGILLQSFNLLFHSLRNAIIIRVHSHNELVFASIHSESKRIPQTPILRIADYFKQPLMPPGIIREDTFELLRELAILHNDNFVWFDRLRQYARNASR